jgi:PAS domain S-box-containing protein
MTDERPAPDTGISVPVILVVDDDANNLAIVSEYLKERDYTILIAEDGASGLARAAYARPDLILLDVLMPGMDGYETCRRLKADPATREIPVIFMTALAEIEHKVKGFEAGAVDYVTKPLHREEVMARVGVHLRIRELNLRLQEANQWLEKRVESRTAELRNSQRRLFDIINFLPDATFAVDLSGEIIIWNRAAERVTAAKAADMLGKGNREYSLPFYGERRPALIDLVLHPGPETERLYPEARKEHGVVFGEVISRGESWLQATAAPLYDSEGAMVGAIESVRDITELKKLEEQLRHAQKMEAVGTLAGGIAHDFNNILTAIIGCATLLRVRLGEDHAFGSYTDDILAASERAANLTRSLLTFSRKQSISTKAENLNEIVKRIHTLLLRVVGEDVDFRIVLAEEELMVMADSGQIEQVLMNLVANARDAMPQGGVLTISTARVEAGAGGTPATLPPGRYAQLTVSDTGQGMAEATRQRIFEPFFTTKEVGKGTGLGLSIGYGIVKQHEGEITVDSEPGKGTTFRVYLKLIDSQGEKAEIGEGAPIVGGTETIMVAEDDVNARHIMVEILEQYGYTVLEAEDGEDVVEKFATFGNRVQLLILDVVMPKKNGKLAYQEIKAMRPDIPVLFISGHTLELIGKRGMLDPEANFLMKPIRPHVLLEKIRELLPQ